MRVLHLEHAPVGAFGHSGDGDAIAARETLDHPRVVEPGDPEARSVVISDHRLGQPELFVLGDLDVDRGDGPDHGRLHAWSEVCNRDRISIRLPAERQSQQQITNRLNADLRQQF